MSEFRKPLSDEGKRIVQECETVINECEANRTEHAAQALSLVKIIGDRLKLAKATLGRDFVPWVTRTFGRKHQWRSSHMLVAARWEDVEVARAWAKQAGSPLATVFSVDGLIKLLRAWDMAHERAPSRKRRATPKNAPADSGNNKASADADLSAAQEEIAELKRYIAKRNRQAFAFRKPLSREAHAAATRLFLRLGSADGEAESALRAIAREHCWFFEDLQEHLRHQNSGAPEKTAAQAALPPKVKTATNAPTSLAKVPRDARVFRQHKSQFRRTILSSSFTTQTRR
jgi:hypothetical protein